MEAVSCGLRGASPAGHFHGNRPDPRAGLLPLGADHRSAGLRALASVSWGTSLPGPDQTQDFHPPPTGLQGAQTYLGELRGPGEVRGQLEAQRGPGWGEAWGGGGATSAAHVPSGTGRPGWELHSEGCTKTLTHGLSPPRCGHSPGGKLQWPLGQGPGARGPAWGAGGRGESGAFFVCKVSLNNGCSALSSSSSSALPAAAYASASKQPARSPQASRPLRRGTSRGRARHSHSLTLAHAQTHVAPAGSLPSLPFSPSLPARSPRAALRMRPQGGRRVELPPPAPPPSLRGRRKREGARERGRQGGLLRKTKERQRLGETGDRTERWRWNRLGPERPGWRGGLWGPGTGMPPSSPKWGCSGVRWGAKATGKDGGKHSPL